MSEAGVGVAMVAVRNVAEKRMRGRLMCMVGLRELVFLGWRCLGEVLRVGGD